jgi:hypothetical protein
MIVVSDGTVFRRADERLCGLLSQLAHGSSPDLVRRAVVSKQTPILRSSLLETEEVNTPHFLGTESPLSRNKLRHKTPYVRFT